MKTTIKKERVIAATATALLFASLIGIVLLQNSNTSLNSILSDAKLKTESLLSEKLSLDKQIDKNNKEIATLKNQTGKLDNSLTDINKKLANKEAELKALQRDDRRIKSLENEMSEIQKMKNELEKQITSLNQSIDQLKSDNNLLTMTTAQLRSENMALADNNRILSTLVADNFRVESLKGKKDKLTVVAKKTKKISVGFDVPQSIVTHVNFKITTPEGKVFTSQDGAITSVIVDDDRGLLASLSPINGEFEISKRIEMNYSPKKKLSGGIYKIEIYNNDVKLGSCQIKLR